jgi:hypothetical protein
MARARRVCDRRDQLIAALGGPNRAARIREQRVLDEYAALVDGVIIEDHLDRVTRELVVEFTPP